MRTVIKNTTSISEYKAVKTLMEQQATQCYIMHRQACEDWQEGEIAKVWYDIDGYLCIEYDSGKWWHYNERGEWW